QEPEIRLIRPQIVSIITAGRQNQTRSRIWTSMRQSGRRNTYGSELYYIVLILAILITGAATIWGPGGYLEMKKNQADLQDRRSRVKALEMSNKARLDEIQNLRDDRETLEKYA